MSVLNPQDLQSDHLLRQKVKDPEMGMICDCLAAVLRLHKNGSEDCHWHAMPWL